LIPASEGIVTEILLFVEKGIVHVSTRRFEDSVHDDVWNGSYETSLDFRFVERLESITASEPR
jgi:hypothetical protein